ncbi:MAG TPA: hypothetical protein VLT45_27125 [Kofleriaceae bacterium]|nr:hypothetical protein [Kofleriaceae bacterium]
MTELDGIAELVRDLDRDGKPSLAWVVRWSQGERDPIAAAWDASADGVAMAAFLSQARIFHRITHLAWRSDGDWLNDTTAIRRAVPVPPTLAELLDRAA